MATSYIALAAGLILQIVLTHYAVQAVGQDGYGTWVLILSLVGYLQILDFGLSSAVLRYVAFWTGRGDHHRIEGLLSASWSVYLLLSGATMAIALPLAWFLPSLLQVHPQGQFTLLFVLCAARVAILLPISVFSGALRGLKRGYAVDGSAVVVSLLSLAAGVFMLKEGYGLLSLVVPGLLLGALQGLFLYALLQRWIPVLRLRWTLRGAGLPPELLSFSLFVFLNSVTGRLVFYTDTIVVGVMLGAAATAIYSLTFRASELLLTVNFRVADTGLPFLAQTQGKEDAPRLRRMHLEMVRLTLVLAVPTSILYLAFNQAFVANWVGPQNYGGWLLTCAFAYLIVHHGLLHACAISLHAAGRIRGIVLVSMLEAALNLGLSIYLAGRMGILGVAAGTVLAAWATSGWYVPLKASRVLGVPMKDLLRASLPPLGIGVLFGGAVYGLLHAWIPRSLVGLSMAGIGLFVAYLVAFYAFGLRSAERRHYRQHLTHFLRGN